MKVNASKDATQDEIRDIIFGSEEGKNLLDGKNIVKEIYVPGKLYNIVVK